MTALFTLLVLAAADGGVASGFAPSADQQRGVRTVSTATLIKHIGALASDQMEGRAPGTKGDGLARAYIQKQFEALGLAPGAQDGGYAQSFDLVGVTSSPTELRARASDGSAQAFAVPTDFIAVAGRAAPSSQVQDAELVFVGYGIVAPEFQWDDFKGLDLKGKVLLVMNSDPEDDPKLFAGKVRLWYGRWDYKYEQAAKLGAAGAIIIHTTPSAGYPWTVVQSSWSGEQFDIPDPPPPRLEVQAWVTEDAARKLAKMGGRDLDALRASAQRRDFKPVPLGVRVSTSFANQVKRITTANVIAKLPGRDPLLRHQAVLYTAHHDHLGRATDKKPGEDAIFNGAVDNASGVAEMLAVAKAFKAMRVPPRRTVYFAAVAAEEAGLLGSSYLSRHLPVPAGDLACNVNIDGANIWGRAKDLMLIGYGKSNLDAVVERVAGWQRRTVTPDQLPDRGFFYRSDQFNFAKLGVPAVYAESGTDFIGRPPGWGPQQKEKWEAEKYHSVGDELDPKWDLSGAVEDTQLYFLVGDAVANQDAMPEWNKGDEFELARKGAPRAAQGAVP